MKRTNLEAARRKKHWTRAKAAEYIGIDVNTLYRWEAGKISPRGYNIQKLCEVYDQTAIDLGVINDGDDEYGQKITDGIGQLESPLSDEELGLLADRLSYFLLKKTNVDRVTLKSLEVYNEVHWKEHNEGIIPSQDIFRNVAKHLQNILLLLEGSLSLSIRLQLYTITSSAALLSGALLFDLSAYNRTREFQSFALAAAQEGNNSKWAAVAWGVMALAWIYEGNLYQALACVKQGRSTVLDPVSTTIYAWLAAIEAEIQAKSRHTDACLRALDAATLSSPGGDDGYWTGYDKIRMEGYRGACLKLLYDPKKPETKQYLASAQTALLSGIAQSNTAVHETRAIYLCDLASTYVLQRDIEGACTLASQALTANSRHSRLVFQRVTSLRQELDRWKQTIWVAGLDSQLETLKDRV